MSGSRARDTGEVQHGGTSGGSGGVGRMRTRLLDTLLHCQKGPLPAVFRSSPERERMPRAGEGLPARMMLPWERRR
jgi:hypothetical protein